MTQPEGIPDYADDESTAYDESDRPRFEDSPALPGDEPVALDDFGLTGEEQREGESLEARLAREEPDMPEESEAPVGRLVDPDDGAYADDEAEALGFDDGGTGEQTAEEAAIHEIPEP
jgi:hypothetical protein